MRRRSCEVKGDESAVPWHATISRGNRILWNLPIPRIGLAPSEERRIETRHAPLGVVAAIAPWNYPVLLGMTKLGPALLAGNAVVLKPSPFTPLTTLRIGELIADLVPPGVINVVSGTDRLGPWVSSHPQADKVTFTGSPLAKSASRRSGSTFTAPCTTGCATLSSRTPRP